MVSQQRDMELTEEPWERRSFNIFITSSHIWGQVLDGVTQNLVTS